MDLQLKGKVIMAAASSRGLGYGIAEAAAKEGAKLSIASRSKESIVRAATSLSSNYGVEVAGYEMDVAKPDSIATWFSETLNRFGRIDGLLINAGGPPPGKFETLDDSNWQQAFDLTLMSAVRMIREVLPTFKRQKSGSILVITSTSIKEPIEVLLLSTVLRSGVASLIKGLSQDFARDGIRINNLVPGRIDTERVQELDQFSASKKRVSVEAERGEQMSAIPAGRYGSTAEFGNAGAFLLSDAASYITGATLVVDGGKTKAIW